MYRFTKIKQIQSIDGLFKILMLCSSMIFLAPVFIGAVNKYFQLIDTQMTLWISFFSILIGILGYVVTIFTLFILLHQNKL
jgi:hypothetical protein